jgi:hypothetical protein
MIKENEVVTFKLNSGEELIAKVIEVRDGSVIIVENPVSVAPSGKGIGLIPSMFTADPEGKTMLNINNVSIYAETDESIKVKYIEVTTGISVPEKKILVG